MPGMKPVSEVLRAAVESRLKTGENLHAIARAARIDYPNLRRWYEGDGRGMNTQTVDLLAEYLGLTLAPAAKPARRK